MDDRTTGIPGLAALAATGAGGREDVASLLLHAETIEIDKRRIEELVRVTRATQTKDVLVEAPLEHASVLVERMHIGRFIDAMPAVREEGDTTILPVVEEVAVVVKRLFLREEVRITRTRTTALHTETVSLREQQAHVTRTLLPPKRTTNMEHEETIVAVYDTPAHAELAVSDLLQAQIPQSDITRHQGLSATEMTEMPTREKGFWASLFGGDTHDDEHLYERSVQTGASVVVVKTPMHKAASVVEILESHHPVDLDERATSYGMATETMSTGATASTFDEVTPAPAIAPAPMSYAAPITTAAAGGDTVQLSEEQLVVGKRLVNRGGTRLRRYVVETPVSADVTLHSETVKLERRPVTDGAVVNPDFSEKTIEMTASAEEAVIAKTAHVVEEVSLRKEATDRVETVHDTVRKEEVEVEQIPGETVVETTTAPRI